MKRLIYVADDEKDIRDVLFDFLTAADYEVLCFPTGDELFAAFEARPCDLVVLDIMMPGTDGLTLCRRLRAVSDVPIIILTARESEEDHMRGFLLGGDDYLIKPFSPALLVVRVNALLRRVDMGTRKEPELRFGDIRYSLSEHYALCGSSDLGLTVTEFALLGCLMENPGASVSRSELLSRVWNIDARQIETRVTDETVRRIREKLRRAGSRVRIAAAWGYGYRLEDAENE